MDRQRQAVLGNGLDDVVANVVVGAVDGEALPLHKPFILEAARRAYERVVGIVDGDGRLRREGHEDLDLLVAARRARSFRGQRGLGQGQLRRGDRLDVEDAIVGGVAEARGGDLVADLEAVVQEAAGGPVDPAIGRVAGVDREHAVVSELGLDDRRRVPSEGPDQRLVNEAGRRGKLDARSADGAPVAVGQLRDGRIHVDALHGVGDVRLRHEVPQHVRQVAPVGRQRLPGGEEPRRDALGKLVHQGVREMIARRVREETVRPGEDLRLLVVRVPRVVLCRPCHVENARQPDAMLDRVYRELAHHHVGECVAADRARVVVRQAVGQRLDELRMHRVRGAVDRHKAVERVRDRILPDLDVDLRVERHCIERAGADI